MAPQATRYFRAGLGWYVRNPRRGAGMRIRKPSPSLVISIIALVMASTGSAIAAVSYARSAGAVDGRSAVGASSSLSHAAGRLVATASGGSHKGKIPVTFL